MYFNYISMKVKKYFKKCKLLGLTPSSEMELDLKFNKLLRRFLETGRPTEKEHPKFNQMWQVWFSRWIKEGVFILQSGAWVLIAQQ